MTPNNNNAASSSSSSSILVVLPTVDEIRRVSSSTNDDDDDDDGTSATFGSNEQQRQRLVMQALNYGTGVLDVDVSIENDVEHNDNVNDNVNVNGDGDDDVTTATKAGTSKALEAGMVLTKAWIDCPVLEDCLVDSLWLCSSLVTVNTTSVQTTTSSSSSSLEQSLKGLITIIKALLTVPNREQFYTKLQSTLFPSILDAVGLGSEQDLLKRLKVHNTHIHYKQHKFSLLQEESEGYSKLLQFLTTTTTMTTPTTNDDGGGGVAVVTGPSSSDSTSEEIPRRERVLQMIGSYELDPNRVLDLTFDALEERLFPNTTNNNNNNTNNDGTVVDVLDYQTNGSKQYLHQQQQQPPKVTTDVDGLLGVLKVLPFKNLSSLLTFKLNNTSGGGSTMSNSTVRTVAFLASEGFIHLEALMEEYFDPVDDDIENAHRIFWMKEKGRVVAAARVNLSGGTTATTNGTTTSDDPKQVELQERLTKALEPLNSSFPLKIMLILIQWGKWDQVKKALSTTLWSHLCCLLPHQFGSALCDHAQARMLEWYAAKVGTPRLNEPWHGNDNTNDTTSSDQIDDGAVIAIDDVVQALADPLTCLVQSGYIAFRPILFCRICRLLGSLLRESANYDEEEGHHDLTPDTYNFFQTFLVPSLSLFQSNAALSTELWTVLKYLPYTMRYKLYSTWRGTGLEKAGLSSSWRGKPLPNVLSEVEAGKSARYVLKRLSKDNIRDMSRQLATVTHSNPLVVYATILSQIESYDNMVEVMVEAQRFVGPLGLDVLGYCILGRLSGMTGGMNRSRLKEDGVNVSQWLQSLEAFTGEFYKRRPFVEFRGILSYLMRRLRDGHVMELGMLRTMLKVAGGYSFADYSPAASLNDTQLEGRAGSVALKRETMSFGIVENTSTVAASRMRHVLQNDGLGVSMLILIAQARDRILFDSTKGALKDVKLVGNLFDACQVVMSILLEFLTDNGRSGDPDNSTTGTATDPIELYSKSLPSLQELQDVSGLDLPTSWFLCRPAVKATMNKSDDDIDMDTDADEVEIQNSTMLMSGSTMSVPESVWSFLAPSLLLAFYMNDLYCIFCPVALYGSETTRIGKEIERIQSKKISGVSGANGTKVEPDNVDRLSSVVSELSRDLEQQQKYVELTFSRLDEKKNEFFPIGEVSQDAARNFLIHCIYPRSVQNPDGAMYSSEFAFRLHKIWTPGFSIIHYIDELILIVAGALYGVTEGEAANLGILLWQTWKVVNRWRYVDGLFEKEVFGKPGCYVECDDDGDKSTKAVSLKDFVQLYNKWHSSLGAAVVGCLESSEYMHTRTALVVLTRLVDVFPTRPAMGNKLMAVLEPLQDESSSRPDIRASASAYGTMLMKARDEGKWVEEDKAVAQARADKERAAAEERKRNLEKTFQELARDSVKITAEIGPRDGFRERNEQRRREYSNPRGTVQTDSDGDGRDSTTRVAPDQFNDRVTEYSRMESGEVLPRDRRDERDRDRRSSREPAPSIKDDDRGRGKVDVEDDRRRDVGGDGPKDRELRWQPPRGTKRSNPSSPGPGDDREDERSNAKRLRLDPDSYPPRRSAGRSDSPPRRPSSPEPPSRSRARRGTSSRR